MAKQKTILYTSPDFKRSPEFVMKEAFMMTCKDQLESFGIMECSVDAIRGATMMLEKYLQIMDLE